jgi:hypothetical protein
MAEPKKFNFLRLWNISDELGLSGCCENKREIFTNKAKITEVFFFIDGVIANYQIYLKDKKLK